MNHRLVLRQLGLLLLVLGGCLLVVTAFEASHWHEGELAEPRATAALAASTLLSGVLGAALYLVCRPRPQDDETIANGKGGRLRLAELPGRREALLLVALSWLVGGALAAVPYLLWAQMATSAGVVSEHPFQSPVRCYFEAISGLTTTGASVLSDIAALPKGLLLWRSLTQWLGGLGIVVLFVAVLPTLGVGGKKLFAAESPGPSQPGVRPRIRDTARALWMIYLGMTVVLCGLLWAAGMSLFDAVCHTFTTLATGGFANYSASIAHFDSALIDGIIIVFMLLAGVNFGLYYLVLRGRWKGFWKDPELRLYLSLMCLGVLVVMAVIAGTTTTTLAGEEVELGLVDTLRYGAFQTVSLMTSTGFATADFDDWGFAAKAMLLTLMFVGGCAGSTGGGIKVIRVLVLFRVLAAEIEKAFRPTVVRPIRVGKSVVSPEQRLTILVYVMTVFVIFVVGSVLVMLFEPVGTIDYDSSATAAAATLLNIGPGFGIVGPTQHFGIFTDASLMVLSLLMVLGRLEVYALLVLVLPGFWKAE